MQYTVDEDHSGRGGAQPAMAAELETTAVRKGPWTVEEDVVLANYIAANGDGAWNSLARAAGLNRTGKSCRLRWLNYLRPDVRRGNISPEEQMLIVELQAKWGNRWSKIARQLPGRTDNEIKNFWRTKIQKKHRSKAVGGDGDGGNSVSTESVDDAEDRGSSNSGGRAAAAVPVQNYGIAAQQAIYAVHGGAAGAAAVDVPPPEFLTLSSDHFWALEDIWPTVHSLHGNC